jgi:hypothetical protein
LRLRDMLPAARVELLDPLPQKPGYRLLLQLAVGRVQNALNEANNTHRAWAIDETVLTLVAGVEDYELDVANIGKILDVVTYDPDDSNWREWQIPFFDLTEVSGNDEWPSSDTFSGTQRISFFRRGGGDQVYARVRPIPQDSASYRVSFNVGSWSEGAALDDEPFLAAHHHYFVCDIARDALPGAEWSTDEKRNDMKRKNLDLSLSRRVDQYYRQFKMSITGLTAPRNTYREEAYPIDG